jgi:hypothetical protein
LKAVEGWNAWGRPDKDLLGVAFLHQSLWLELIVVRDLKVFDLFLNVV